MVEASNSSKPAYEIPGRALAKGLRPVTHAGYFKLHFLRKIEEGGRFAEVRERIYQQGMGMPTPGQGVSLLYDILKNPESKFAQEFLKRIDQGRPFYLDAGVSTSIHGCYVQDHPDLDEKGHLVMERLRNPKTERVGLDNFVGVKSKTAIKFGPAGKLRRSEDGLIRYVSGMQASILNNQPKEKVKNHPLVVVIFGLYGMETLVKIVSPGLPIEYKSKLVYIGGGSFGPKEELNIPSIYFSINDKGKLVIGADAYNTKRNDGFTVPLLWPTKRGTTHLEHLLEVTSPQEPKTGHTSLFNDDRPFI